MEHIETIHTKIFTAVFTIVLGFFLVAFAIMWVVLSDPKTIPPMRIAGIWGGVAGLGLGIILFGICFILNSIHEPANKAGEVVKNYQTIMGLFLPAHVHLALAQHFSSYHKVGQELLKKQQQRAGTDNPDMSDQCTKLAEAWVHGSAVLHEAGKIPREAYDAFVALGLREHFHLPEDPNYRGFLPTGKDDLLLLRDVATEGILTQDEL